MFRFFVFFILIVSVSFSCREKVQDEFEPYGPVPVVNSIIQNDSLIKVHVSLARELDDEPLTPVDNATVMLYSDGEYTEDLSYQDQGIYVSDTLARVNIPYEIYVVVPGFDTVRASCIIPAKPDLLDVEHIVEAGLNSEGLAYPALEVIFETKPGELRYYEIVVNCFRYEVIDHPRFHTVIDPVLQNEGITEALFSNELIRKNTYTLHLNYSTNSYGASNGEPLSMNLYPLIVELRAVNYDYYKYQKHRYLYENGRYPEFSFTSQQACQLYSNVNNGHGIFAGYSSMQTDTIYPKYSEK